MVALLLAALLLAAWLAPAGAAQAQDAAAIGPWQQEADANQLRAEGVSVAVNGKMYVFAGFGPGIDIEPTNEVYDPATGTWTPATPDMPRAATHVMPAVVGDEVWFAGGRVGDNPGPATAEVKVYDASDGTWETSSDPGSSLPALPNPRAAGGLVNLNGKLHYFGGLEAGAEKSHVLTEDSGDHYVLDPDDPGAGWSTGEAAPMPQPRNHFSAAALGGKIYAIGGQFGHDRGNQDVALMHVYDPATNRWSRLGDLPYPRSHAEPGTIVHDGKIILVGGETGRQSAINNVTSYDPSTDAWTEWRALPEDLIAPAARVLNGQLVVSHGGKGGATDPQRKTYAATLASSSGNRGGNGEWKTVAGFGEVRHENAFVQAGGKFYLLGGRESNTVRIYDPASEAWSNGAASPIQLHHFEAVEHNGLIYVVGAMTGGYPDEDPVEHVYIYDPAADTWTEGAQIPADRRRGSGGTAVYNGKIYLVSGNTNGHTGPVTAQFDVFDPATGTWTALDPIPNPRDHFFATVSGGKLYAIGGRRSNLGEDNNTFDDTVPEVDVYDFSSGRWSTLPSASNLPTPRAAAPTERMNGEIIVAGGESNAQSSAHAEVEAFDPGTQSWRALAEMPRGRHGTQATVSNGGFYVVAGSPNRGGPGGQALDLNALYLSGETDPGSEDTFDQTVGAGWNLVGLPLSVEEASAPALFPDRSISGGPFGYTGRQYVEEDLLEAGQGYWVYFAEGGTQTIEGTQMSSVTNSLEAGWNLVASPSCDVPFSEATGDHILVGGTLTGYDGAYVSNVQTLEQGKGYWVYADAAGDVTFSCGSGGNAASAARAGGAEGGGAALSLATRMQRALAGFDRLTVADAAGHRQTLHFGATLDGGGLPMVAFSLPAAPPAGAFDVRFVGGAQQGGARLTEAAEGHVRVQASRFPLAVTLQAAGGGNGSLKAKEVSTEASMPGAKKARYTLEVLVEGRVTATHELGPGQPFEIANTEVTGLRVKRAPAAVPGAFAVRGNYPNPVRSGETSVVVDLPEGAQVEVAVYDMLGREVVHAGPERLPAGPGRTLRVPAGALSSGVYLYRVTARFESGEERTETGRLVVAR